ncbi:MAG: hypothetical protein R3E83_06620 [Burkholderiaceae bacterium]
MQDYLLFTDTANITGVYNGTTGVLTLSGTDTVAAYQAALRSIRFQNTSNDPSTATRTLSFVVTDGVTSSNTVTRNIDITAVNDAPVLNGIEGAPLAVTENGPATAVTATLTVSDVDSASLASATVSITANYANGEDLLGFADTANITGSWNASTGVLSLSGSDSVANYQAALRSVTYRNLSDDPSTLTRTVSLSVHDGALSSNVATRDIIVSAINDWPVLATIEAGALAVTEGDPATAITATMTVSDPDDIQLNAATISITANYVDGEDQLAFTNTANITGGWNSTTGVLTLTGIDTVAAYQAALRSVTYQNLSNDPSVATRTVEFIVTDGSDFSLAASRDIAVTPVGDPPSLAAIEGTVLAVTENDPGVPVTASLTVSDPDSATLVSASVAVSANYVNGEDLLAFADTANITGSWNAATGVMTLSGVDTLAAYQAAEIGHLQNLSDDPSTLSRTLSFSVSDGALALEHRHPRHQHHRGQ